ncbi:hypothetical protein [Roseisolibacter agri]|uniref:Uncharacterized protein n=1 Tax=Roseisolibacter agri TaxID=2014610 RepID=A0AA37QBH9_9BACT|nr:hypothetical protein [Roseisolibacter agri]GLC28282.1 hypothetical protein rosag_47950 [Roseisolibacter agri]
MPHLSTLALARRALRASRRLGGLAATVAIALSAAACWPDGRGPTAPTPSARPSLSTTPEATSQSFPLEVPPTNTNGGGLSKRNSGIAVPDGAYAMIEVSGGIAIGQNPEYMAYCSPSCSTPYAGQTATPMGVGSPQSELLVRTWVQSTVLGEYQLATVAKAGDPYTRVAAGRWKGGAALWIERTNITGGAGCYSPLALACPGGTAQWQAGTYTLAGAQEVRITPISAPTMAISAPAAGTTTRAFTVSWPYLPATTIAWAFSPTNDTGPTPANYPWPWLTQVPACNNMTQCSYAPPSPGRMYASLGGPGITEAIAVSIPTSAAPPQMAFSCTPGTVVRGATVSCTASVSPATPYRVTSLQVVPSGTEGPHTDTVGVEQASGTSWTTAGEAAVTSVLNLAATAHYYGTEVPLTATASFTASPRSWPTVAPAGPPDSIASDLPSLYTSGKAAYGLHTNAGPDTIHVQNYHVVASGPNAGFWLLDAAPIIPKSKIRLHPALSGLGTWGQNQDGRGMLGTTGPSGLPYCGPAGLALFRDYVRRHEGMTVALDSHEGDLRRVLVDEAVHVKYERIAMYRPTYYLFRKRVHAVWGSLHAGPLAAAIAQRDSTDYDAFRVHQATGCELDKDPFFDWPFN